MRIPLVSGRDFTASDDANAPPVAIINTTLARLLWPDQSPLERTFHVNRGEYQRSFRVVGVAADAELRAPGQAPTAFYYVPLPQSYNAAVVLHVRGLPGRTASLAGPLREAIRELDPALPVPGFRPINEALSIFLLPQRLAAWVAGLMSIFGMLLAAVGVYGVSAFMVTRRAREVAVRMALGATAGNVTRLLLRRNGPAPLAGLVVGAVIALVITVAANRFMSGVPVADPLVVLGVPALVGAIAAAAILAPVRSFLRQPMTVMLRDE